MRKLITGLALALAAAALASPSAARTQDAPVLSVDDSLICAGLFFAHSKLPENANIPDAVSTYESMTVTMIRRAEILAGRLGESTDGHVDRAAEVADQLLALVDAETTPAARMEQINSWNQLEDLCVAGGSQPT